MASSLSVFRIAKAEYIKDLSGTGSKMYGGRWNRPGIPVLYTSQARSLAMLELFVHFNSRKSFKHSYMFLEMQIKEELVIDITSDVQNEDFDLPNNVRLWAFVDKYFLKENACCVKVPSVLVPDEYNYLINPESSDFSKVEVLGFQSAFVDERYARII